MPDQHKPPSEPGMDDLLKAYKALPSEQPSEELTQRVLTDAANALDTNRKTTWGGRLHPATAGIFAAAACAVIAIGIGVSLKDPTTESLDTSIPRASRVPAPAAAPPETDAAERRESVMQRARERSGPDPNARPLSMPEAEVPESALPGTAAQSGLYADTSQPLPASSEASPKDRSETPLLDGVAETSADIARSQQPDRARRSATPESADYDIQFSNRYERDAAVSDIPAETATVSDPGSESASVLPEFAMWERLIAQARQAQHDQDQARFDRIRTQLLELYPGRDLPEDLVTFNNSGTEP